MAEELSAAAGTPSETDVTLGASKSNEPGPLLSFRVIPPLALREAVVGTDEVVSAAAHNSFAICGTRQGSLFRLDIVGQCATPVTIRQSCINDVSIDMEGRHCACACADGRISVVALDGRADPWLVDQGQSPVLSVALCPDYSSGAADSLCVCGGSEDGRLVLHRRSLFGKQASVHEGEGAVTRLAWRGRLVAWANKRGVKIFDVVSGQKVTYIQRPQQAGTFSRCLMSWASHDRLLIAWDRVVKIAFVLGDPPVPAQQQTVAKTTGRFYVEVKHQFVVSETVCGLASIGPTAVSVLTANQLGSRASISLYTYSGDCSCTADVPRLRGAFPDRLHFGVFASHLPMLIVAPRDLVSCEVRDFLEHTVQLLDLGRIEEAIEFANHVGDGVDGLCHLVCLKVLVPELQAGSFDQACMRVGKFRSLESSTWREVTALFDRFGGLQHLAVSDAVPVPPRGKCLPPEVYDELLGRLISYPSALVAVLHWWPADIFSASLLLTKLRTSLSVPSTSEVIADKTVAAEIVATLDTDGRQRAEALALLESVAGDPEVACRLFLDLGCSEVFKLLQRDLRSPTRCLVGLASSSVRRLFEIDDREATNTLVDVRAVVGPDVVVGALAVCAGDNRWRHEYLKHLFSKDEVAGQAYHMQMVRLFAEYEPKGLLAFLRASERYPLEDALGVCQQRGLLEEEAFVLGRAGRVVEALDILLEKMQDVGKAVIFAAEYQDPKLWEDLVAFVLDHPNYLVPLLEHLDGLSLDALPGGNVGRDSGRPQAPPTATPAHVLRKLLTPQESESGGKTPASETPVPRIASSVRRIFDSFELLASIHTSCSTLSSHEMTTHKRSFMNARQRGVAVKPTGWQCGLCGRLLTASPPFPGECGEGGGDNSANGLIPRAGNAEVGVARSASDAIVSGAHARTGTKFTNAPAIIVRAGGIGPRQAVHKQCDMRRRMQVEAMLPTPSSREGAPLGD